MAKKKSGSIIYKCTSCGYTQPRWLGRCPECGEWNSLVEHVADQESRIPSFAGVSGSLSVRAKPVPLASVIPWKALAFPPASLNSIGCWGVVP